MRIHHLNCISTCPLGGRTMDASSRSVVERGHLCNHCLLIETDSSGLVLIDTGLGIRDVESPHSRLSRFFLNLVSPDFRLEMTAYHQVRSLGFNPEDVRHIIITHLDFDHAGGLDDFPNAQVHMLKKEREYASLQKTWLDRQRFRPQQWGNQKNWTTYIPGEGESWYGFSCVRDLAGLPPEILLIPLVGHTHGHTGIAVKSQGLWHLLAGDAYFFYGEMDSRQPWCTPGLKAYQAMMDKNRRARLWNQERLRHLKLEHSRQIEIFCSHDVTEFERLAGRSAKVPADKLTTPEIDSTLRHGRILNLQNREEYP